MDLRYLKTLAVAAEGAGFTRPTEVPKLTQAVVGQQVAAIQQELGTGPAKLGCSAVPASVRSVLVR